MHQFKVGDELTYEDTRNRFARALPVRVVELLSEPDACYLVEPRPCGRRFPAFELELWMEVSA